MAENRGWPPLPPRDRWLQRTTSGGNSFDRMERNAGISLGVIGLGFASSIRPDQNRTCSWLLTVNTLRAHQIRRWRFTSSNPCRSPERLRNLERESWKTVFLGSHLFWCGKSLPLFHRKPFQAAKYPGFVRLHLPFSFVPRSFLGLILASRGTAPPRGRGGRGHPRRRTPAPLALS